MFRIIRQFYAKPASVGRDLWSFSAFRARKAWRVSRRWRASRQPVQETSEGIMSKGMDSKKSEKKKPEKTLKEKRAAKTEKKKSK